MPSASSPACTAPGRFGIRIEDIVVCTADGPDVLNEAPRDLLVVAGAAAATSKAGGGAG